MGSEAEGKGKNTLYALQEEEEVKWLKDYSSAHQILLVGEGDFSFSLCLAKSFGSASNIIATSLDSYAALIQKYKHAMKNVVTLTKLGATVLHEVDATRMKLHPDIGMKKFDRIVYNFPHAGFHGKEDDTHLIRKHKRLVNKFLWNARRMLRPDGEVHVNHKTTTPFSLWNLPELALRNSLTSLQPVDFRIEDFPGYSNKRGDGLKCDEPFPLGDCSTFKFIACKTKQKTSNNLYLDPGRLQTRPNKIPRLANMQNEDLRSFDRYSNDAEETFGTQKIGSSFPSNEALNIRSRLLVRSFGGYLNHVEQTFGTQAIDAPFPIHEAPNIKTKGLTSPFGGYLNHFVDTFGAPEKIDVSYPGYEAANMRSKFLVRTFGGHFN